jgi:hypothetical protein
MIYLSSLDVPGLIGKEFIQKTCMHSQELLEAILDEEKLEERNINEGKRERMFNILDCVNTIHKEEIADTFFVPILRETSIEYIIQKVLTEKEIM